MNIPREHSICQNVVVVGGVGDVARRKLSSLLDGERGIFARWEVEDLSAEC